MTKKREDFVILVDENDNETGISEKLAAHRKALMHRAISVFICNSKGEWLLQRRALNKYHSNGLWTNTCCSHPFPGETNMEAAQRRLEEEMGLTTNLTEIFWFRYKESLDNELTENELDHVFIGFTDKHPKINKNEVNEWQYLSFDDIKADIKFYPEKYTVWFKMIFDRVNNELSKSNARQQD
ncbi:isopentenyl-diphosphate Delta-isomerase [Maribellus comscasis]|uniref:Isopentenyl-diphosphate delta-isomerase n=1 Tax=Maribellus comscasis TaxID=2681766 RepID=A0A6I6JQZ4_9BACT|nr:isopentenyl-diphosphate Delta-isomerase [Maribellus comscasis]QGY42413.1 isopentenyl-diphosphate Delta-isomerase [Maribellus comscasis]